MKRNHWLIILIIVCAMTVGNAQTLEKENQLLLVREDIVEPSNAADYETALLNLTDFLRSNSIKDVNYVTTINDNFHYIHFSKIKDLNEIEGGMRAFINRKKDEAGFNLAWEDLAAAMNSYHYYVVKYLPEYSYVKDGNLWLEESPFRRWNMFYFKPGSEQEVEKLLGAWKALYENKGIESGYRVFMGVLGLDQPVVIMANWAKSPLELQQQIEHNVETLGDDGSALLLAMLDLANYIETVDGYYIPEFSYSPN